MNAREMYRVFISAQVSHTNTGVMVHLSDEDFKELNRHLAGGSLREYLATPSEEMVDGPTPTR